MTYFSTEFNLTFQTVGRKISFCLRIMSKNKSFSEQKLLFGRFSIKNVYFEQFLKKNDFQGNIFDSKMTHVLAYS